MALLRTSRVGVVVSVVGDVAIVLITFFVVWAYNKYGVPFNQGFFCNDDSIRYPYKTSTISTARLLIYSIVVPWLFMMIWDSIFQLQKDHLFRRLANVVFETTMVFLCGFGLTFCITDIGKYSLGSLRPHFISVCKPEFSNLSCADVYIQNYRCLGSDAAAITEARLSFPSGHASISFYGFTYFAMFLWARLSNSDTTLIKPFLMAVVLSLAFYISLSRVFDYYHHPGDVLFGGLLGASVAILMSVFVAKLRPRSPNATTHNEQGDVDINLQRKLASQA